MPQRDEQRALDYVTAVLYLQMIAEIIAPRSSKELLVKLLGMRPQGCPCPICNPDPSDDVPPDQGPLCGSTDPHGTHEVGDTICLGVDARPGPDGDTRLWAPPAPAPPAVG